MKKRAVVWLFLMSLTTGFLLVWNGLFLTDGGLPAQGPEVGTPDTAPEPLVDTFEYQYDRLLKEGEVAAPTEVYRPKRDPRTLRYDIRVAYFSQRPQAEALLAQLRKRDIAGQIVPRVEKRSDSSEERTLGYQVVIPAVVSRSKANAIMDHLADLKLQPQLIPLQIARPKDRPE